MLTCAEAAALMGLSPARVRALCASGKLPARKSEPDARGLRAWEIEPEAVAGFTRRPAGNPNWRKEPAPAVAASLIAAYAATTK